MIFFRRMVHMAAMLVCIQMAAFLVVGAAEKTAAKLPPVITDFTPGHNSLNISPDAVISVTFDIDMNGSSFVDSTFVVNGAISGLHQGSLVYDGPSRTVTFDATDPFAPGEVVTVALTTGIQAGGGEYIADPWLWSFTIMTNGGTGRFVFGPSFPMADMPAGIAAADFNGDALADLATANFDLNSVTVFHNNGDSTFVLDSTYAVGASPRHVCIGDLNGDGHIDIIAANYSSDDVSVLLNAGDGTFIVQAPVLAGVGPRSIIAVDVDIDGDLDLATANQNAGGISVLTNDGSGAIVLDSNYQISDTIFYLYSADLNYDGNPDLVSSSSVSQIAFTMINLGNGVFSEPIPYDLTGNHSRGTTAADFDGDGYPDMATANDYSSNVSVLLNEGDGTFGTDAVYGSGTGPFTAINGDVDCDGDIDLATANGGYGSASVLFNDGNGAFALDSLYQVATSDVYGITLADLDGDGDLDMAAACLNPVGIRILFNKDSSFVSATYPACNANNVAVTDSIAVSFNWAMDAASISDTTFTVTSRTVGRIHGTINYYPANMEAVFTPDNPFLYGDLITVEMTHGLHNGGGQPVRLAHTWEFMTAVGGGIGRFQDARNFAVDEFPRTLCAADLDGDGLPDLAVGNHTNSNISVLLNNGDTTFTYSMAGFVDRNPYELIASDLDGDDDLDIISASVGDNSISICYNDGSGGFESIVNITEGLKTTSVAAADFNGDGHPDLAGAKLLSDSLYVYLNDGLGVFAATGKSYFTGTHPYAMVATDVDFDADLDLVSSAYGDGITYLCIHFNNGAGNFSTPLFIDFPDSADALYAADFNGDGFIDLATANFYSDNVSVLFNNGTGNFPAHTEYDVGGLPNDIFGGDFDGDGSIDLATANQTSPGSITVLLNDGAGLFDTRIDHPVSDSVRAVCAADMDGDGDVDLISANGPTNDISLMLNKDSMYVEPMVNPETIPHGDSCLLQIKVAGDPDSIVLNYRLGGETEWNNTIMTSPDSMYQYTIETDPIGLRSTAYYFEIFQADRAVSIPMVNPETEPNYIRSELSEAEIPGLRADAYQMIGFSFDIDPGDPDSVFVDDLGAYNIQNWRLGHWNPDKTPEPGYDEFPEIEYITRQDAYWFYGKTGTRIDADGLSASPDTVINDTAYACYELKIGWNQISTPFGFPVSWSHRRADVGIEAAIYAFSSSDTGSTYISVDTLEPFKGYFVKNSAPVTGYVCLPYIRADLLPAMMPKPVAPRYDMWQATLSLESGGASDISNILGVRPDSKEGGDAYDLSEPPLPPGMYVSLGFERVDEDNRSELLSGDFREPGNGWGFDLLIRGNSGQPAYLSLADTLLLPSEFTIVLIDNATGQGYNIPRTGSMIVPHRPTVDGLRYKLLVGNKEYIEDHIGTGAVMPNRFQVYQNHPNPFNLSTTIKYDLPVPGHVRLELFNILGQKVTTLIDGNMPAGSHSQIWNGHDDNGQVVASGVYIYRLSAAGQSARKKMVLLK